jgi:hypothetical protein
MEDTDIDAWVAHNDYYVNEYADSLDVKSLEEDIFLRRT